MLTKYDKYRLLYSPRTSISNMREREEKLFNDLGIGFEPSTIEIMKKHFKERTELYKQKYGKESSFS